MARHEVAVKALAAHSVADTVAQARFRLVARTVLQLSDPGIALVREFGETELPGGRAVPYLVRDLVPGQTLGERLRAGPLPPGEALRVVAATAAALAVAHRAGIAHGHLVPANIILAPDGVQVTDFGLWALRPRPDEDRVPGAVSYAAPELADGGPASPAADMYALGVVFVACLAGIGPGGLTPSRVGAPRGPAEPASGGAGHAPIDDQALDMVPASLAALWAACLGPDPAERPSAAHAAVMSQQVLTGSRAAPAWSSGADLAVAAATPAQPGDAVALAEPEAAGGSQPAPGQPARDGQPAPPPGTRRIRSRRRRLVTVGGVATGATAAAVVVGLLLTAPPQPRPASPASSTTAARASYPVAGGPSPAGTGSLPTPEATSPVLATSTPAPTRIRLSPLAAIGQLSLTIAADVADGQVRQDVGVDFDNLIQPVKTELAAGRPAPVAQLATTLREKLWTRVSEGAVTVSAATVLSSEISALASSAGAAASTG
jgi:eukaryotic-like serine/threonine-protein kinase